MISSDGSAPVDDAAAGAIIVPAGHVITVSGQPATVAFHVELPDGTQVPCDTWSVDDTRIGSIGSDGVFHADGYVGGVVTVNATVSLTMLSTTLTVNVQIADNAGNLSTADQDILKMAARAATPRFAGSTPTMERCFRAGSPLRRCSSAVARPTRPTSRSRLRTSAINALPAPSIRSGSRSPNRSGEG